VLIFRTITSGPGIYGGKKIEIWVKWMVLKTMSLKLHTSTPLSWILCCRYVRAVVVCIPSGQCGWVALTLLRAQLLRFASEARFIPHLSIQRRHAVQQCVRDRERWLHTRSSLQHLVHWAYEICASGYRLKTQEREWKNRTVYAAPAHALYPS